VATAGAGGWLYSADHGSGSAHRADRFRRIGYASRFRWTPSNLNGASTIAVGPDGFVYIADTGNDRVRAVAPDGTIRTLVRIVRPTGLAIGPHDQLYIAASDLFRLSLVGLRLQRLTGWNGEPPGTSRELLASHFANAYGDIAVDREGDVFEPNFPQLYERTAAGHSRCDDRTLLRLRDDPGRHGLLRLGIE
jgi:hypothetical protein